MKNYFVYIIQCRDRSFYTGVTNNIELRFAQHEAGEIPGCYTHNKRPLKLVFIEETNSINAAIDREKQIKGWTRRKKKSIN